MKTKKLTIATLTLVCSIAATTLFTACGDDDEKGGVSAGYSYFVEFNIFSSIQYDQTEVYQVQTAFDRAVGYDGTMYKAYQSRQDARIKASCEAVTKRYTNLSSLYLNYSLYCKNFDNGNTEEIATYELGRCTVTPYAKLSLKYEYDTHRLREIRDSLLSLQTHDDSVKWDNLLDESNSSAHSIILDYQNSFTGVLDVYKSEAELETYNEDFCESIAAKHAEDPLLMDLYIGIEKRIIPGTTTEKFWTKVFKANMQTNN